MSEQTAIWIIESPITMIEGEEIAFSVDWQGATKLDNPNSMVYRNGINITELVMDSEDEYVLSNNVLTLKRLTARDSDGGSRYVVLVEARVNGNLERRKLLVHIVKANSENN